MRLFDIKISWKIQPEIKPLFLLMNVQIPVPFISSITWLVF